MNRMRYGFPERSSRRLSNSSCCGFAHTRSTMLLLYDLVMPPVRIRTETSYEPGFLKLRFLNDERFVSFATFVLGIFRFTVYSMFLLFRLGFMFVSVHNHCLLSSFSFRCFENPCVYLFISIFFCFVAKC